MADDQIDVKLGATDDGLSQGLASASESTQAASDKMGAAFVQMTAAVTSATAELTDAIVTSSAETSAALAKVAESEDEATSRIAAMVAASLEAAGAIGGQAAAATAYAASVDELAASATAAERASASMATAMTAATAAQAEAAAGFAVASTVVSDGAVKVAEALNRQLVALTASAEEMTVYDAQMAGFTETEVAQIAAIAAEVEARKAQIAVGEEMAAVYAADTVAAEGAGIATAGVTREIAVLGGEAIRGNFSRLLGSFVRLLSLSGMLSLVLNPVSIALIAVGGSMLEVSKQTDALNEALAMTGGYAGVTTDKLKNMAAEATADGASFNTAIEAVTALAASGRLTGDEIERLGKTTADAATYTSLSVKDMVNEFKKLEDEPVKASLALNQQYQYLTAATYDQIAALEKQGDATGAAQVAVEAFAAAMDQRTHEIAANEGVIEQGWHSIKNAIEEAIQAVGSFGAKASAGDIVSRLQANKSARQPIGQWSSDDEAELQKAISARDSAEKAAADKASGLKQQQAEVNAKHAYDAFNNEYATPAEKRMQAINKYLNTIAGPLGLSPEKQMADEQKIDDKYPDKKPKSNHNMNSLSQAELALKKASLQAEYEVTKENLDETGKMYDAEYAKGLISIKQYYDGRLAIEQANLKAQIEMKEADIAAQQKATAAAQANSGQPGGEAAVVRSRAQLIALTGQLQVLEDKLASSSANNAAKREEAEQKLNVAIEQSNTQTQQKIASEQMSTQLSLAQSRVSMGQMTNIELLQLEQQLEDQKYEIARAAIQKRLDLENSATYKNPAAMAKINNQLLLLDTQYNDSVLLNQQKLQMAMAAPYTTMVDGVKNTFATGLTDMLNGTKSFQQGLTSILSGVLQAFDKMVVQMAMQWLQGEITKTAATQAQNGVRTAFQVSSNALVTSSTAANAGLQTSMVAAAESAKTSAVLTGNALRTTSDWQAATESVSAYAWAAIKNIATKAWEAAAAVYSAIASIPYVGPFLAPVMAIAAAGTVIGFAANIASAEGGFDIPSGVNPVTQLHEQEMVLPKAQADVIRRMANQGVAQGEKASGDTHVHIHAVDAASFEKRLSQAGGTLQSMIRKAHRDGAGGQLRNTWGAIT